MARSLHERELRCNPTAVSIDNIVALLLLLLLLPDSAAVKAASSFMCTLCVMSEFIQVGRFGLPAWPNDKGRHALARLRSQPVARRCEVGAARVRSGYLKTVNG